MKNAILMTLLLAATGPVALAAAPDSLPMAMLGGDPLTRQIMADAAKEDGGSTAVKAVVAVRGAVIELKLADLSSSTVAASLAPAVSPEITLKPAPGLAVKPAKHRAKKPAKRAVEQLKRAASPDAKAALN